MNDLLRAALRYADRGWRVFPLNGKEPIYPGGFTVATTKRRQIKAWWAEHPTANIGIACDSQHGPLVIDIDEPKKHEVDGFKFLRKTFPDLAETTMTARSRQGRLHLYFSPMKNRSHVKRMIRPFRPDGKKVAIDILGDGGYVVAPPSIHPDTGKPYRWINLIDPAPFPRVVVRHLNKKDVFSVAPPLPDIIHEGERDSVLTSLAGTMRRRGATPEAILEALRVENTTRVRPPLPDKQLSKIAFSIGKKPPHVEDEHRTDLGNARRFIEMNHKKVRAILAQRRRPWIIWSGQRWELDATGETERMAKLTVRTLYKDAMNEPDEEKRDELTKFALQSESAHSIRAMLELAATEPEISLTPDQLDANPWLFNVQNGTLNLKTGELQPHRRGDYITKISKVTYDADATAPLWERFLGEIFDGNDEIIAFLKRALGYSMTGDTREHCLFFCYGQGRNGKSTLLEVFRDLMGEYAAQSTFTSFQVQRNDGPRSDIARMRGARFVSAVEANAEKEFDAATIKQMTGGDTVVARKLYEDFAEYKPEFKLWLAANHKPVVREQTVAFWERIRLIPFNVIIPAERRKKNLLHLLRAELPGILNWALEGCLEWQRTKGLHEPERVLKATRSYREEHDVLGEFIESVCVLDETGWTATPALYQAFADWWTETRGHRSTPLSLVWFGRMLSERTTIKQRKRGNTRGWQGIIVKDVSGS